MWSTCALSRGPVQKGRVSHTYMQNGVYYDPKTGIYAPYFWIFLGNGDDGITLLCRKTL